MQRKIFARQLMMLIRKSGMRQIELAERIGVSSAAISQFVHGVTLPTQRHILAIFDALQIPAKGRSQIQYQLMLARSEPRKNSSNQFPALFPLRTKKGLSIAQVEARTGICQERIVELEQDGNATISDDEKRKFSEIYGIGAADDDANYGEAAGYDSSGAPQIMVSDPLDYNRDEPIHKFAWRNIRNFLSRPVNDVKNPVIAQAFSNEIGFLHDGLLQLVLTEAPPSGYEPLELRLYQGGIFRLWQPGMNKEQDDVPSFETHGTLLWSIPVAEIVLQPLRVKSR